MSERFSRGSRPGGPEGVGDRMRRGPAVCFGGSQAGRVMTSLRKGDEMHTQILQLSTAAGCSERETCVGR